MAWVSSAPHRDYLQRTTQLRTVSVLLRIIKCEQAVLLPRGALAAKGNAAIHAFRQGRGRIGKYLTVYKKSGGKWLIIQMIGMQDADGIALAAIQGLNQRLEGQRQSLDEQQQRIAELEDSVLQIGNPA